MESCHCAPMIWGFWSRKLPQAVLVALADKPFNSTTYKELFQYADKVHEKSGGLTRSEPAVVAAVTNASPAQPQQVALPYNPQQPQQQQVAASTFRGRGGRGRGRGRGRGNSNNATATNANSTNNNSSNNSNNARPTWSQATRHSDNPPPSVCSEHWRSGSQAKWCYSPLDCPWVNRVVPRQNKNKNQ